MIMPGGFELADETKFLEKLNHFAALGAAGMHAVLEF